MREFELALAAVEAWYAGDPSVLGDLPLPDGAAPLVDASFRTPFARVVLRLRQRGVERSIAGGAGPVLALVAEPVAEGDAAHLFAGAVETLPRLVAELVDLGPRPFTADATPVVLPSEVLDAWVGVGLPDEGIASLQSGLDGIVDADAVAALVGSDTAWWALTLEPAGAEPQTLEVIDAGSGGLWLVEPVDPSITNDPDVVQATPINSGGIWALLSTTPNVVAAGAPAEAGSR